MGNIVSPACNKVLKLYLTNEGKQQLVQHEKSAILIGTTSNSEAVAKQCKIMRLEETLGLEETT